MPNDYAMFEQYWIDQFADLLNVLDNRDGKSNSTIAKQVINAIQAQLKLGRRAVPRDTT